MTLLVIAKATLVLAAALAFAFFAKRATAATRHALITAAQLAAITIPLLVLVMPPLAIDTAPAKQLARKTNVAAPDIEIDAPLAPASAPRNIVMIVWLTGAAIVATRKAAAYANALAIVRRAKVHHSSFILHHSSFEVEQPSTLFHWILLPESSQQWDAERKTAVLEHEHAHVARRDTWLALIGDAATTLYWFHPFAWLAAARARLERERACDDLVLARGVSPDDYASVMLDVARGLARRHSAAMPMADRSHLEQRIRAILDPHTSRRAPRTAGALTVVALLAAVPLLAAITPIARPRSIEPDLLGDAVASPYSERVDDRGGETGQAGLPVLHDPRDAKLAQLLAEAASRPPRTDIDFVPERARWALTRVRNGRLVEPLIESLRDNDWRIRAYAAWALAHSGDTRATAPLIALLEEDVWRVRAMAAHAIALLGDPRAESAMLSLIDDPAWQVRSQVVAYLGAVDARRHRATLRAMLHDRHIAVRANAEKALE